MIKGYKATIMDYYDKIRTIETRNLKKRKQEVLEKCPEIIDIENEIGKLSVRLSIDIIRNGEDSALIEQAKEKITDLRIHKAELLVANGFTQDYLNMRYQCPICRDTGYIGTTRCKCFDKYLVKLYYKNSELADTLNTCNFDNFNKNYYSNHKLGDERFSPRHNIENILSYITNDYIPNFATNNDNLLFYGDSGTGKTYMSYCIAKELLDKGFLVIYRTSDELSKDLKKIAFENDYTLEDTLLNCDLLIIDDLGAEQITEFSVTSFFTFLNKKLIKNKKMLISTNLSITDLNNIYAERICSRLFGNFKLQKFYTDDIRLKINLSKK